MTKVLVTGGGTFVGREISLHLSKKKNLSITSTYNKTIPNQKNKFITYKKLDLNKKIKLTEKYEFIVHCAFKVPSDGLTKKNYKFNNESFEKLLKFALEKKCNRIIFLSAVSIYGKPKTLIINENTLPNNPNLYGKAKIECEKKLISFCEKEKINYTILRLPGIVGKNSKNNFLSKISNQISQNNKIKLFNLDQKFNNVLHVKLLGNIINEIIQREVGNNIYLVGSTYPIKVKKIIEIIYKKLEKKINIKIKKLKRKNFLLSSKKIKKNGYELLTTKKTINLMFD